MGDCVVEGAFDCRKNPRDQAYDEIDGQNLKNHDPCHLHGEHSSVRALRWKGGGWEAHLKPSQTSPVVLGLF